MIVLVNQLVNIYKDGDNMPLVEVVSAVAPKTVERAAVVEKKSIEITAQEVKNDAAKAIESTGKDIESVIQKLSDIKSMSPEQLREYMEKNLSRQDSESTTDNDEGTNNKEGLTDEQKQKINEETGWPNEIVDAIGSWKEYEIYKNAGLVEAEINGKKCLIRTDINWNQKDAFGRTNKERAEQGLSPINKEGKPIELHHIGQHADSPLAELKQEEHRGKGNDSILHNKTITSEIDRMAFSNERSIHWQARANEGGTQQ